MAEKETGKEKNGVSPHAGHRERIREQYALLQADHSVTLEWNPGNHFQDSEKRTARAFCRIAAQEK